MADSTPPAIEDLQSTDVAVRRQAAERFATLGPQAAPAAVVLIQALADADEEIREFVNAALEDLGPPPAELHSEIERLLVSDNDDLAFWSATLLGRLKNKSSVAALVQTLKSNRADAVRERAASALGEIGASDVAAQQALQEAGKSGKPRLARLAGEALAKLKAGH